MNKYLLCLKVEAKKRIEQREKEDKPANFNLKLVAELKVFFVQGVLLKLINLIVCICFNRNSMKRT